MKKVLFCLLVVFLLATLGCARVAMASGNSGHGDKPHWGYVGETGPDHWGGMMRNNFV